jgi:hypothetical protein
MACTAMVQNRASGGASGWQVSSDIEGTMYQLACQVHRLAINKYFCIFSCNIREHWTLGSTRLRTRHSD